MDWTGIMILLGLSLLSGLFSILIGAAVLTVLPVSGDPIIVGRNANRALGLQFGLLLWPILSFVVGGAVGPSQGMSFLWGGVVGLLLPLAILFGIGAVNRIRRLRDRALHHYENQVLSLVDRWTSELVIPPTLPRVEAIVLQERGVPVGTVVIRFSESLLPHAATIRSASSNLIAQIPTSIGVSILVGSAVIVDAPRGRNLEPPFNNSRVRN